MSSFEFPFWGETDTLNDEIRATISGEFIRIPQGVVHYEMSGPSDHRPIVLVHGFSVPYFIWDPANSALTDSGFRVLRYDLFGRGYSDRPHVRYDTDLFDRQLLHLLDSLGIMEPVDLAGLSMGGVVAVNFASRHPERVNKLALIDPAGFRIPFSINFRLMRVPFIGEIVYSLRGTKILLNSMAKGFLHPHDKEGFLDRCHQQMKYKGYKQAIISTMRNGMLGDFLDAYRRVGEMNTPMLLIWGQEDRTVPIEYSRKVLELVPQVRFHVIEDAGHIPHYERPEEVTPLLIDFFRDQ
jgi:pimeloyl-ACP methyl ester carboxylesterase